MDLYWDYKFNGDINDYDENDIKKFGNQIFRDITQNEKLSDELLTDNIDTGIKIGNCSLTKEGVININNVDGTTKDEEFKNRFEVIGESLLEDSDEPFIAHIKTANNNNYMLIKDKESYFVDFGGSLNNQKGKKGHAYLNKINRMNGIVDKMSKITKKYKLTRYPIKKKEVVVKKIKESVEQTSLQSSPSLPPPKIKKSKKVIKK